MKHLLKVTLTTSSNGPTQFFYFCYSHLIINYQNILSTFKLPVLFLLLSITIAIKTKVLS